MGMPILVNRQRSFNSLCGIITVHMATSSKPGLRILPDPAWNVTDAAYPDELLVHELFEQQVVKSPQDIALIDDGRQYSYTQINDLTNRLARALQQHGVGSESIVGCYLTRSSAIVFCTLATLKAGGAYILLDANMPAARLDYIISDAKPAIILADVQLPELDVDFEPVSVSLAELYKQSQCQSADNLAKDIPNSNAAYIAYTSGSTGSPKGVVITHNATVNHACAFRAKFHLTRADRVPLMAPIAFDMAIEEMVPPLVSGCTLIVSSPRFATMEVFHREILQNEYTILNIPAPLWQEWAEYMAAEGHSVPPSLRLVITGSEKIDTNSFEDWRRLPGADKVAWVAAYGTTETTVTSTFYTSAATDDLTSEPCIPIGKPIANTYAYILDGKLREVPVGEQGELYIGGKGLARGYYHREELTQLKFIPDPIRGEGTRMYRTGDVARFRTDGNMVWLGRTDTQFKLNGLRIEPGEIESVLKRFPGVAKCVVVLQRGGSRESDKQIVAFVTVRGGQEFDGDGLRRLAVEHLPGLMLPQRYVHLLALPLSRNGKIDRKALEDYAT